MAYEKPILTGRSPRVDRIDVEYGLPDGGYWPMTLRAVGMTTRFEASEVFPPFFDLIRWLEGVLDGECPELFIDDEGAFIRLYLFPYGDDVRLAVINERENDDDDPHRVAVDVAISRTALVESFYLPLMAIWESELLATHWVGWSEFGSGKDVLDSLPRDQWPTQVSPYPIRSARIDAALRDAGRTKG